MNDLRRRVLEELLAQPGSEDGLRQRIGRMGVAGELARELQHLSEIGLIRRASVGGRQSPLDQFKITPDGLSLLGEQPSRVLPDEHRWPHDPDIEGIAPEFLAPVTGLVMALLDGAVMSIAQIVEAVNATRGREWVTEAGILEILVANPDVFVLVRPGLWTMRVDPGAQGAGVPARPYRPHLEGGAAVALEVDEGVALAMA